VPTTAGAGEIRAAYRRLARVRHPDRVGGDDSQMAALNEAYHVLADPARRAIYDASLRSEPHGSAARPASAPAAPAQRAPPPRRPAQFPWKWAFGIGAVAALAVFLAASLYRPAGSPPPDGLLEPGSCVVLIEADTTAREVPCDDAANAEVHSLIDRGDACPFGTAAYRDPHRGSTACVQGRRN
jgi:molecular chaperone DnaJ